MATPCCHGRQHHIATPTSMVAKTPTSLSTFGRFRMAGALRRHILVWRYRFSEAGRIRKTENDLAQRGEPGEPRQCRDGTRLCKISAIQLLHRIRVASSG